MTEKEFIRKAAAYGYATKKQAKQWRMKCAPEQTNFSEEDFKRVYRFSRVSVWKENDRLKKYRPPLNSIHKLHRNNTEKRC